MSKKFIYNFFFRHLYLNVIIFLSVRSVYTTPKFNLFSFLAILTVNHYLNTCRVLTLIPLGRYRFVRTCYTNTCRRWKLRFPSEDVRENREDKVSKKRLMHLLCMVCCQNFFTVSQGYNVCFSFSPTPGH